MKIFLFFLCCLLFQSCKTTYDLVIEKAKVFDTKQGVTLDNKTILINADTIINVVNNNKLQKGKEVIDATGKAIRILFYIKNMEPLLSKKNLLLTSRLSS